MSTLPLQQAETTTRRNIEIAIVRGSEAFRCWRSLKYGNAPIGTIKKIVLSGMEESEINRLKTANLKELPEAVCVTINGTGFQLDVLASPADPGLVRLGVSSEEQLAKILAPQTAVSIEAPPEPIQRDNSPAGRAQRLRHFLEAMENANQGLDLGWLDQAVFYLEQNMPAEEEDAQWVIDALSGVAARAVMDHIRLRMVLADTEHFYLQTVMATLAEIDAIEDLSLRRQKIVWAWQALLPKLRKKDL